MDPAEPAMLDVIVDIWPILASLAAGLATVGWALWKIYIHQEAKFLSQLEDPESRDHYHQEFNDLLSDNRFDYASYLQSVLNKVDSFFDPHAFSAKSYELCLKWAFAYPIILGFLFFLISNQDISGFGLFPSIEEGRLWKIPLIFILIASMIYSFYKGNKEEKLKKLIWFAIAFVVAGVGVFTGVAFSAALGDAFTFAIAGVFAGAGAGAVAGAGAFAGGVGVFAAFANAGVDAFAVAFVVASGILIAYVRSSKKDKLSLFYPLYFAFLAGFIWVFLWQDWILINKQIFGFLLFLVVLPTINSVLDWLSLGMTRFLLKKSLSASGYVKKTSYYLLDLAIALLSLLVLIFSLFVAINGMSLAAGLSALEQPAYDLGALWQRIESQSVWQTLVSPDGWIFMMIFSTFLPSLIHGLAFGGFLLTFTRPDSSKITRFAEVTAPDSTLALNEKNEIAGYLARQSIANIAFPMIGVVLLAGVILAVLLFFGDIVTWLISG